MSPFHPSQLFHLRSRISHLSKISSGTANGKLTGLLDLGLEDNLLVTLLPHLGDERLAGVHGTSEADLDVLKGTELLVDRLAGNAERAETVQDGHLEASHLGELGVDVERVVVTAESVDGSLLLGRLLLDDDIRGAVGHLVDGGGCAAVSTALLAAEAATAPEEDGHLVVEELLARLGVDGGDAVLDNGGGALVDDLEQLGLGDEAAAGRDGVLLDLEVLLAVQQHHGVEVGDDVIEAVGGLGVKGRDDAEGRENLEVLVALTV